MTLSILLLVDIKIKHLQHEGIFRIGYLYHALSFVESVASESSSYLFIPLKMGQRY